MAVCVILAQWSGGTCTEFQHDFFFFFKQVMMLKILLSHMGSKSYFLDMLNHLIFTVVKLTVVLQTTVSTEVKIQSGKILFLVLIYKHTLCSYLYSK